MPETPPPAAADLTISSDGPHRGRDMFGALALVFARLFCDVRIRGQENLAGLGGRVLFVANHVTFIDPVLVRAAVGRNIAFAIDPQMAALRWVRPFARLAETAAVDPAHPFAIRALLRGLAASRPTMIFPEGRLTMTGSLMHLYDGAAFLAARSGAVVVPIHVGGLERSFLTRMSGAEGRRRLRPTATVTIGKPFRVSREGGARWSQVTAGTLRPAMDDHGVASLAEEPRSLALQLRDAIKVRRRGAAAMADGLGGAMGAGQFLDEAKRAARQLPPGRIVALAAGRGTGALAEIVGLWLDGRVPALHPQDGPPPALPAATDSAVLVLDRGAWRGATLADLMRKVAQACADLPLDARDKVYQPLPWLDENVLVRGFLAPWLLGAGIVAYGGRQTPSFQNEAIYIANASIILADPPLARALISAARPLDLRTVRAILPPEGAARQLDWRRAAIDQAADFAK